MLLIFDYPAKTRGSFYIRKLLGSTSFIEKISVDCGMCNTDSRPCSPSIVLENDSDFNFPPET